MVMNAVAEGLATALPASAISLEEQTRRALQTLHAIPGELMRFVDDLLSTMCNAHPHAVKKLPSGT
jgi:hypothetical protein